MRAADPFREHRKEQWAQHIADINEIEHVQEWIVPGAIASISNSSVELL